MTEINQKQQKIVNFLLEKGSLGSGEIYELISKTGENISLVTVKRLLSDMVKSGFITSTGAGRATRYKILTLGRIFSNINPPQYCSVEPDKRYGLRDYNFELFNSLPADIFDQKETEILKKATAEYKKRTENLSEVIKQKELERLIIELSWKSSKIEGNTYTLLDTEKLILENKEAVGHDKREAIMILNHKNTFKFIYENKKEFTVLTRKNMEEVHKLLIQGLDVDTGFRKKPVGVTGSTYLPLDNIYQIEEAVQSLVESVSKASLYSKALITLLGISYIQPFEDGNKRTSRLMANALLLAHDLAPLSYRSVEEKDFKEAVIVFYEINSIMPFKKIFVDQYDFAARNYAVK